MPQIYVPKRSYYSPMRCAADLRLPITIVESMIDQFDVEEEREVLRQCALVCKAWLPRSRFRLFQIVYLKNTRQLNALCGLIERNPCLRRTIQYVHVSPYLSPSPQTDPHVDPNASLHNLAPIKLATYLRHKPTSWEFNFPLDSSAPQIFRPAALIAIREYSHVQALSLNQTRFSSLSKCTKFLSSFSGLRTLRVGPSVKIMRPTPAAQIEHITRGLAAKLKCLVELEVLYIRNRCQTF